MGFLSSLRLGTGLAVQDLGNLIGLPEMGISEKIAGRSTPSSVNVARASENPAVTSGTNSSVINRSIIHAKVTPTGSPSGTLSGNPVPSNNDNGGNGDPYYDAAAAARSYYDANKSAIEAQYGKYLSDLDLQEQSANTGRTNALSSLSSSLTQAQDTGAQQKTESEQGRDTAIKQAADTARSTQRMNRNVLRALGILGSSYAADKLQEPTNAFDEQRANVVQTHLDNVNKVDTWLRQQQANYSQSVKEVEDQYSQLLGRIQNDRRFSQEQKVAAFQQAGSAYEQALNQIGESFANAKSQANQAVQNLALQIANVAQTNNPNANLSDILSKSLASAQQYSSPITTSLYDPTKRKELLSGL